MENWRQPRESCVVCFTDNSDGMIEAESTISMRTRDLSRRFFSSVRCGLKLLTFLALVLFLGSYFVFGTPVFSGVESDPKTDKPPDEPVAIESRKVATTAPTATSRSSNIRVDKTLVLINVTVTDPLNRFVTGLEREHFRLYEDKVEQDITAFSSEDAPISIGLVFDTSGSMGSKLQKSRQAAAEFFKTSNPSDEFFLVQFNDRPELTVPFTTDTDKIQGTLTFTQSRGRTALLDSVYLAMHEMKKAHNPRKAVLIISDGGDNSSRYTETEIKNAVREADVQIFAIGIYEGSRK